MKSCHYSTILRPVASQEVGVRRYIQVLVVSLSLSSAQGRILVGRRKRLYFCSMSSKNWPGRRFIFKWLPFIRMGPMGPTKFLRRSPTDRTAYLLSFRYAEFWNLEVYREVLVPATQQLSQRRIIGKLLAGSQNRSFHHQSRDDPMSESE